VLTLLGSGGDEKNKYAYGKGVTNCLEQTERGQRAKLETSWDEKGAQEAKRRSSRKSNGSFG